eukprot:COSAG01_NODE_3577_length_5914_cov_24.715268_5_plen_186_part_00
MVGVAALVADLVHARATALLGHASAAVLAEMIAGCELANAEWQARAEERHPPAVMCRGVEQEDWLKQRGNTVCKLGVADLRALIVCRTGVTKVSDELSWMKGGCGSFRSWVVGCDEVAREWSWRAKRATGFRCAADDHGKGLSTRILEFHRGTRHTIRETCWQHCGRYSSSALSQPPEIPLGPLT